MILCNLEKILVQTVNLVTDCQLNGKSDWYDMYMYMHMYVCIGYAAQGPSNNRQTQWELVNLL